MATPTKGFTVKRNLGGFTSIKSPMGTFNKPGYSPKPKAPAKPANKPGLGAAPAPAPGKDTGLDAPRVGQHMVPDAAYNSTVDTAVRQGQQRLGALDGQETVVKHDFGIDDPTNPFSRAEGLKRSYLAKQKGVSASLAAQGHLYSGQHERALSRTRLEEEQARADLRAAYDQALQGIAGSKAAVGFQTEEARNQAFQDWLARAPEASADLGPAADAAPAPAPTAPAAAAPPASPDNTDASVKVAGLGNFDPTKSYAPNSAKGLYQRGYLDPSKKNSKDAVAAARAKAKAQAAQPGKLTGTAKAGKGGVGSLKGFGVKVKPKTKTQVKPKGKM